MSSAYPQPLIVCGMGRSGTRMCANILNNSHLVELQGEIGGPAGTRLMAWLESARLQRRTESFEAAYDRARQAFKLAAAGNPTDNPEAGWFGHKTPRHERHFLRYETIFDNPENRAIYVYCIRNPFDVWRSYRAMPWNKFQTVDAFLKAWLRSVHMYEAMAAVAPERVLVFNLDQMLRSPTWSDYLDPELFSPLGLSADTFRRQVESLRNTNSAENKTGTRPEPISEADRAIIASHPEVRRIVAQHFPWLDLDKAPLGRPGRRSMPGARTWERLRRVSARTWKQARREWKRSRAL